jgi:aspartyl protease family protein
VNEPDPDAAQQRRIGGWMYIGFWILLLGFMVMFFNRWMDHERNPNQHVASHINADGVHVVELKRSRMGHYNVTGTINGHTVEFMLDTGATDISIPASVAQEIGLKKLGRMQFYTANGLAEGYATRLEQVRVGDIVLRDLEASINPNVTDDVVLLGMSFLKKIEFTQRGDTLILRQ